jgi:outer membrane protein OmpA-like peptidoglycan-associated protein
MAKFITPSIATLAVAMALSAPAHGQLLRGGLGGGLSGGLGLGGGFPIGVHGGIDGAIDAPARMPAFRVHPPKAPKHVAPAAPAKVTEIAASVHVVASVDHVVPTVVAVPAIPDVAVRRAAIVGAGIAPVGYAELPDYVDQQYVVLQNELRGSGVTVERQGQQIVLEMPSDVTFAFNKYDIQPRFFGVLDAVSQTLARFPASYVDVNGHTDAVGSFSYNQILSERRADSVADFLAAREVNPARLHVEGFGKTEPVASNATIAGRAANRRVEIILTPYAA